MTNNRFAADGERDVLVIGGGLAGLSAALVAAERKKKVTLITEGAGTLPLSGGVIDVLARSAANKKIVSPKDAIPFLSDGHPYGKIGLTTLEESIAHFLAVTKKYGLPYHGSLDKQIPVATAIGTIKPTCLAPVSLDASPLFAAQKIVVAGIRSLKDFFPALLPKNLKNFVGDKEFVVTHVDLNLKGKRDITMLDVARKLDTDDGIREFAERLAPFAGEGTVFLTGQFLGTDGESVAKKTAELVGAPVIETVGLPPAVNGLRLQKIYMRALDEANVEIIRAAKAVSAVTDGNLCRVVKVRAAAREKLYAAEKFILATGGFYSGGITMKRFDEPVETVFNLPVSFVSGEENWADADIFADAEQGFALTGITVDSSMRPVDKNFRRIFDNVFVVGKNLGGYDYCFEHSGNGVALSSAYKAAIFEDF